jgi:ubiquinol-cytochrome c reductase cytochrome b/c1 subunit
MSFKRTFAAFAAVLTVSGGLGLAARAAEEGHGEGGYHPPHVEHQKWSFSGLTGRYDTAQLKRGFLVYNQVCSNCHSMNLLSYRNLMETGGPEFTKAEVEAVIAQKQVPAEPNDDGEIFKDGQRLTRPALMTDRFVAPFANEKAAMAANGGALPPDLSVMAKARGIPHIAEGGAATNPFSAAIGGVKEYAGWIVGVVKDISTQYQEGGPDYVYALMTGYEDAAPAGVEIPEGKFFNHVFPGHAISMPPQIMDDLVTYEDGTKATKDQIAHDVAAFLMWAAEPTLDARKRLGLKVLIYLLVLSGLMYAVKRAIWSGVKH